MLTAGLGSVDKKDTLSFEKKNIFFEHATLLFKILIINITQVYVVCKQKKKSRYRETPAAYSLPAFLCTCFLVKWLGDFKSSNESDADFVFG